MAVFRVELTSSYAVMSKHHFHDKSIPLKAKELLPQMLRLPESRDYTLAGLASINKESSDVIRTTIWELENTGYIVRHQGHDEKGKMIATEYYIYEKPQLPSPISENPTQLNNKESRNKKLRLHLTKIVR